MVRRVFFSFHYKRDAWRAAKVRNIGAIDGNPAVNDNDWEEITKGEDAAIKKWIREQMQRRTCAIVLIGTQTAGRKWIDYEIKQAWKENMGVLGIHIHNLTDRNEQQCKKGKNPFAKFEINGKNFAQIVHAYDPPRKTSKGTHHYIADNIEEWVETAISIRQKY